MDLLHQRYASPFPFLNNIISAGRFYEFVCEFVDTFNKEREERHNWEFFLHRVFDKSYAEFIEAVKVEQDNRNMSETEIETTISKSQNILANFNPEERG